MHRRKVLAVVSAAAAVLIGASGCSGTSQGGSDKSFTYWSMWKKGEPQQVVLQSAIDGFTKKTGIKVNVQWSGRDVLQQVSARLSAGNPPDLFDQDGSGIIGQIGKSGGLLGLDSLYQQKIDGENDTIASVIPTDIADNYKTSDGQRAIVPYEIIGSTLWYNGLAQPTVNPSAISSWNGFVAGLDTRKAAGNTAISLDGDIPSYEAYWLQWAVLRHAGAGSIAKAAEDKTGAIWKGSDYIAAFDDVLKIADGGYLAKGFNATKFPAQQTAWAEAGPNAGYLLMGTWAPSETGSALTSAGKNVASIIQYKSVPYPTVDGGKGNSVVEANAIGFAIAKNSRQSEAAEQFISYFMNKSQLSKISTEAKNLVPRSDIPAPEELAGYAAEFNQKGAKYVLGSDGTGLSLPAWETNVWEPAAADLFNGKYPSAKAFADDLAMKTAAFHKNAG